MFDVDSSRVISGSATGFCSGENCHSEGAPLSAELIASLSVWLRSSLISVHVLS